MSPSLALQASSTNLHRVAMIRLIVIAGQLGGVLFASLWLQADMDYGALLAGIGALALITGLTFWRLHWQAEVSDREFLGHLVCDIGILSIMLYYSGGITNPFVSYYLVPICISAALLPTRFTAALTALSLMAHSVLLVRYQPMAFLMPEVHDNGPHLHLLGMWFEFAISAILIGFFVSRMASALREQHQELNLRRENALRQQQLVSVATLAAGTAHELGTPLSTMTVLLDELIEDQRHPPPPVPGHGIADADRQSDQDQELVADLHLLKRQVEGCRNILKKLVATAETHQRGNVGSASANEFVRQALDRWQVMRPAAHYLWKACPEDVSIPADPVLEQALLNLLNNAADANAVHASALSARASDKSTAGDDRHPATQPVEVAIATRDRRAYIQVLDRGDYRELPGQPFVSTKPGGLGLGVFLSRAAAERYGGSLQLQPRPGGGAIAQLELPIIAADTTPGGVSAALASGNQDRPD